MPEPTEPIRAGFKQVVKDKKVVVKWAVIIAIIIISVTGNAWALLKYYTTKAKDAARAEGWAAFAGQMILQSEGCRTVDVTSGPLTERFIRVNCLTPPGATTPGGAPTPAP